MISVHNCSSSRMIKLIHKLLNCAAVMLNIHYFSHSACQFSYRAANHDDIQLLSVIAKHFKSVAVLAQLVMLELKFCQFPF